jgi:glycosyltransferase involved in cell wall biosynthesis
VVDDGSTDATSAIAREFVDVDDRFALLVQEWSGQCAARNRGMQHLAGRVDFLTFMDADDVWLPDALETLLAAALRDPTAIGAHGLGDFIDEHGQPFRSGYFANLGRSRVGCRRGWPRRWDPSRPTCFETVATQSIVFPPGLLIVRADAYEAVGDFDDGVRLAEDWDMLIRLTRRGVLVFVDEVVLWYRRHDHNVGASDAVAQVAIQVRQKTFFSTENTKSQRRIVRDSWRAAQVIDGAQRLRYGRRCIAEGNWQEALLTLSRLPFLVVRYVRGRPPRFQA